MRQTANKGDQRLAGQVFDRLLSDIVSGRLPPGTPMAELDLCNRLGVSRTPVREALIKLAEADLVHIYPQSGSFVAPISRDAFRDAQFIREHLECAIVAEAVRYIDATSLHELQDILGEQDATIGSATGAEDFYAADEAFHNAIARIGQRVGVWHVVRQTKVHFDRVRHLTLVSDPGHIPRLIAQHREIVEALASFDEARAVAAMRMHLREVFRRAETIFTRQEEILREAPKRRRRTIR